LQAVQEKLQKTEAGIRFNPATTPLTESLKQTFKNILQKALPDTVSFNNSEMPLASQPEMPLASDNLYGSIPPDNQGPFKADGTLNVPEFRNALGVKPLVA
jgi:hypothetical protein